MHLFDCPSISLVFVIKHQEERPAPTNPAYEQEEWDSCWSLRDWISTRVEDEIQYVQQRDVVDYPFPLQTHVQSRPFSHPPTSFLQIPLPRCTVLKTALR